MWKERMRAGLAALLAFLEYEPATGHLLIVDELGAGPRTLQARREVLASAIAASPGASSKQVATASGISDPGQISRLLTRLRGLDLIEDGGAGPAKGLPRAWSLTERGENVLQAVGQA